MSSVNSPNHHKNLHAGVKCNAYKSYSEKIHAKIKEKLFIECTSENVVTMPTQIKFPFNEKVKHTTQMVSLQNYYEIGRDESIPSPTI